MTGRERPVHVPRIKKIGEVGVQYVEGVTSEHTVLVGSRRTLCGLMHVFSTTRRADKPGTFNMPACSNCVRLERPEAYNNG